MIYEARVTGKYETRYWVQIPTKYGQQDVGPIKATGFVSPSIGQIVYVGYLPTADTFVILAGPEGAAVVSWGDIANKPSTFTPAAHNHSAANITSGTLSASRLPVVTTTANGAMLAADKVKLDAAAVLATPGTLALRNSGGQIQVADPGSAPDAANRRYVDAQDALRAPLSHSHAVGDLVPGVLSMTHLRLTSTADASETSTAHAFQIGPDGSLNIIIDNNEVIGRNNGALAAIGFPSGISSLPDPAGATSATRKSYVDGLVAGKSDIGHVHAWADITGKPSTFTPAAHNHSATNITSGTLAAARLPVVTTTANGAMLAADKVKLDGAGYDPGASRLLMTNASNYAKAGAFFMGESTAQPSQGHGLTRRDYVDGLASDLRLGKLDNFMQEIGDAENLDNYTTTGQFHQSKNVQAASGANYPAAFAGKLEVWKSSDGTFVYQEYTTYQFAGRKYYRCKYGSSWLPWKEVGVRTAPAVWETVSVNTTNFGLYSGGYAEITEDNGLVTLAAALTPKAAVLSALSGAVGQHALTIPSKYIPAKTNALIWVLQGSGQDRVTGSVESDGRFTLGRYGPNTPGTGAWLPIYCQWRL